MTVSSFILIRNRKNFSKIINEYFLDQILFNN